MTDPWLMRPHTTKTVWQTGVRNRNTWQTIHTHARGEVRKSLVGNNLNTEKRFDVFECVRLPFIIAVGVLVDPACIRVRWWKFRQNGCPVDFYQNPENDETKNKLTVYF